MNISILGATGSIGRQTVEVAKNLGIKVNALAAGSDYEALAEMAKILQPSLVALYDENAALLLKQRLKDMGLPDIRIEAGMDGVLQCATFPETEIVVNAIVGSIGLRPTLAAISAKKDVALANKETLVAGGVLVMEAARENGVSIRPTDSEHSAIWQCLQGGEKGLSERTKRLILTASGGAFRTWDKSDIEKAKAADALRHPNWTMGPKITIDCATMMNKGLEYIEAYWLFDMPYKKIDILVHPQSVIHSMVAFEDGAVMAQLAAPDMGQPIQYALTAPDRPPRPHQSLDFLSAASLTFEAPDLQKFPCLALAMEAGKIGGTMPAMMNAANEQLVAAYLKDEIRFYDISRLIEAAMASYTVKPVKCLADVEEAEAWAGEFCDRNI
ncbi:MAG: 1-deoxy-D-xylulose-5-phosphate reductoisomerase [Defluviitaleaceae bacterium]|nr:1-deoxy-D-xylulose-5-phosphate reductoisomerase [Defluviitaleaceae bacterium]